MSDEGITYNFTPPITVGVRRLNIESVTNGEWEMSDKIKTNDCCQDQHEATKNAILEVLRYRIEEAIAFSITEILSELYDIEKWINDIKLEDTK